jgi:glycine/D-amino acid oxidase-like deaminating enzyme
VGGIVDPARLAWGLRDAVLRSGVRLYERTPMLGLARAGGSMEIHCAAGRIRAQKAVLATNAFRSPVGRMRRATIPVWDYALMSEPLSESQMASVGWKNRQGIGDSANQFHYYRLTEDDRILWGGYDAIYHYGNRIDTSMEQRAASFEGLSRRFFATFPQLEGLCWTHSWGGPIASSTRFCMDVGTAYDGRVSWAVGYTGLGVVATRYGARLALDLLDNPEAPALQMRFVKKRALPWPPEPLRALGVAITQRAMARADRNEGRSGLWLKLLDAIGVGFDS